MLMCCSSPWSLIWGTVHLTQKTLRRALHVTPEIPNIPVWNGGNSDPLIAWAEKFRDCDTLQRSNLWRWSLKVIRSWGLYCLASTIRLGCSQFSLANSTRSHSEHRKAVLRNVTFGRTSPKDPSISILVYKDSTSENKQIRPSLQLRSPAIRVSQLSLTIQQISPLAASSRQEVPFSQSSQIYLCTAYLLFKLVVAVLTSTLEGQRAAWNVQLDTIYYDVLFASLSSDSWLMAIVPNMCALQILTHSSMHPWAPCAGLRRSCEFADRRGRDQGGAVNASCHTSNTCIYPASPVNSHSRYVQPWSKEIE